MLRRYAATLALAATGFASAAQAQDAVPVINSGDTGWILSASALVLLMTLPGLGLFYGGLVRSRNFLSVLLQCGAIAALVSVLWIAVGYTLAFGDATGGIIGNGRAWMFLAFRDVQAGTELPESSFALFQMTFAVIAPVLMVGAWAERARFGWVMAFCGLWSLIVYAPVAHWVWGGGWLARLGVLDFAGGIVVHTTAGVSALVVAVLLNRRVGFPEKPMLPHAPALTMVGAALLWAGWFGFNGGSALVADGRAAMAVVNTHLAASVAALVWLLIEKLTFGKPTIVGWATGAIAGLAAITPAAGFVSTGAAMVLGALAGVVCYGAIGLIKKRFGIDDTLDVFAVHGVGGILGTLLLAIFASDMLGGIYDGATYEMGAQLVVQFIGIAAVALWSAVATAIIALMVSLVFPMRVSAEEEREGLDITSHGERAWELN